MVERQLIPLASQLQLIDRLQHLIYLSSSLIFLSGEQGSGKSTLVEQLSNKLPDNIQQVFIQLNDQSSDAQVRQKIITQLYKQPLFDAQDSLFTSISRLQEKQSRDTPRLIILDHSHYLSSELLIELLQIIICKEQFGESDVNVLLLASENDNQRMISFVNEASLNQERVCTCLEFRLEALSCDESTALLNHIFKQEQYQPKIQHQDALQKQLTACAGIPQKIIALAEQISAGEFDNQELSWLKIRLPAILLMSLLLIIAAGLSNYLYPKFFNPLTPAVAVEEIIEDETVLLSEIGADQFVLDDSAAQEGPELVEKLAGSWSNKETTEIKDNPLSVGIGDEGITRVVISDPEILDLAELAQRPASSEEAKEAQPENLQREEKSADIDSPSKEIAQVSEQEGAVVEVNPLEINDTSVSTSTVETITPATEIGFTDNIEPKTAATAESQTTVISKEQRTVFTASAQLLAIAPAHFTLQLSAMASEKSLQDFILEHKLPQANIYLYQTVRKNKPWYVVIYGDYENLAAAKKASKTLPASLANMNPWIKKYQRVHQDLRLNNE